MVLTRYGSTPRSCRQRLLLHSRKQLLLSFPSLQSDSSRRNQEIGERDEGKCSSNSSTGLTRTNGRCPGVTLTIRIASGFRRSCCSRRRSKRFFPTTNDSFESFHPLRTWRVRKKRES